METNASVVKREYSQLSDSPEGDDDALSNLVNKEPLPKQYGIIAVSISVCAVIAAIGMATTLPASLAAPLCLVLYAVLTAQECRHKVYSPQSLFQLGFAFLFSGLALSGFPLAERFAPAMCSGLALVTAVCLALKQPDSLIISRGSGARVLHMAGAWLWLAAFTLGALALWLLPPSLARDLAPPLLALGAALGVVYFNVFDDAIITRRKKQFTFGEFEIRKIDYHTQEFEDYLDFYAPLLAGHPSFHNTMPVDAMRAYINEVEDSLYGREIFLAYHHGKIVGCIASAVEDGRRPLPAETALEMSFAPLFRLGRIANFGRFGIDERFRGNVDLYNALQKAILESCFVNDVAFLLTEVFPADSIYQIRLGFTPLFARSDSRYIKHFKMYGDLIVLICNMAGNILYNRESLDKPFHFFNNCDPLLAERWLKRMVLFHVFSKPEECPWRHTIESVRSILGITQSAVAAKYKSRVK